MTLGGAARLLVLPSDDGLLRQQPPAAVIPEEGELDVGDLDPLEFRNNAVCTISGVTCWLTITIRWSLLNATDSTLVQVLSVLVGQVRLPIGRYSPRMLSNSSTSSRAASAAYSSAWATTSRGVRSVCRHRTETFKLSRDPLFIEKVRDIVGLYLHPPERAVMLCVDKKPQTQALERSQPVLPMRPVLPKRRTHD